MYWLLAYALLLALAGLGASIFVYFRSIQDPNIHAALQMASAAFLGGTLYSLVGTVRRALGEREISRRYVVTFYFAGPWIALILGTVSYFFVRAGVLELGGISGINADVQNGLTDATKAAWFVAGVSAGVAWPLVLMRVLEKGQEQFRA